MENSVKFFNQYGVDVFEWQKDCGEAFVQHIRKCGGKGNMTVTAATNSGKSVAGGLTSRHATEEFGIEKFVIVVPTTLVQTGWPKEVLPFGINLTSQATNARLVGLKMDPDLDGFVVTYQQVSANSLLFRKIMEETKSMVLFDEFHHMGRNLSWGTACAQAFEHADITLSLSATPYRMDGQKIPFQEYEYKNGEKWIKSHFARTPSENIDEGISRPVELQALNAELQFIRGGEKHTCTFEDDLDERLSSDRLNTFLDPRSESMETLVRKSMKQVLDHRNSDQPNAALLYIAKNINHANAIGDVFYDLFKIRPVIATDEEDNPSQMIRDFADDPSKIVMGTVNLLKEGANIKRARVGLWATNITSQLTFEQVMGRFNRKEDVSQTGHSTVFIPADRTYLGFSEQLEGINLVTLDKEESNEKSRSKGESSSSSGSLFVPIQSQSLDLEAVYRGEHASPEVVKIAQDFRQKYPDVSFGISDVQLGALAATFDPSLFDNASMVAKPETYDQKRDKLSKVVNTLSNKLAFKWGVDFSEIHREWIRKGNPAQANSTLEELQSKIDWIISEFNRPGPSPQFGNPFGEAS